MSKETVPKGYKRTEVGVIPEEWSATKLGEIASFRTGPFGSALHKSDYTCDGIPIVNPMHIINSRIELTRTMTVTESAANKLTEFRIKTDEIVIGRRGDMGRCAVVTPDNNGWLCGTGSMIIRPQSADPHFLQMVLASPDIIASIVDSSVGTTMVNLNQSVLSGLYVQFPPKAEQQAIAAALSDADALIESLESLLAKKRQIKQGAMQELLTGKRRLPGFTGKWEHVPLGKEIKLLSGHHVLAQYCNDEAIGCPYITGPSDFTSGSIQITKFTTKPTTICEPGDILITVKGSGVGSMVVADGQYCISRQLMAIRVSSNWSAPFIYYCLRQESADFGSAATGLIPGVSRSDLLERAVLIPEKLPEQTAIATVLSDMDAELEALEAKLDKARQVKQGMMQQLLTGKVRLI